MAGGGGGGRRRSAGAAPGAARRSSGGLVASAPRGGPPWPPLPRQTQGSPVGDRPLPSRRSPRLHSQKENVPVAAPPPPPCPPASPPPPLPSPLPLPPAVAPRVRRSYSRLEAGTPRGLGGAPLSPIPPNVPHQPPHGPSPHVSPPIPPPDLPGIGLGPERRRKKKVAPIDLLELEAWAARMNAQFEEAERFRLVVE